MRNLVMLLHCPGAKLIHIIPRSAGFPGFFSYIGCRVGHVNEFGPLGRLFLITA